jgi:hypothetical protein
MEKAPQRGGSIVGPRPPWCRTIGLPTYILCSRLAKFRLLVPKLRIEMSYGHRRRDMDEVYHRSLAARQQKGGQLT